MYLFMYVCTVRVPYKLKAVNLPSNFDYIFVNLRQKAHPRPELSPKFLSTLGPNPARTQSEKNCPTYHSNSSSTGFKIFYVFLHCALVLPAKKDY